MGLVPLCRTRFSYAIVVACSSKLQAAKDSSVRMLFNRSIPLQKPTKKNCSIFSQGYIASHVHTSQKGGRSVVNHLNVFNDPIHGQCGVTPLLIKIIERLRAYYVFPGASHNTALNTPLGYVCIVCLCHDLGETWAIFHLFDGMFLPKAGKKCEVRNGDSRRRLLDHLVDKNDLKAGMKKYGLEGRADMLFIKEDVGGRLDSNKQKKAEDKSFLYEIVANKTTNALMWTSLTHFARDCHHLASRNHFGPHHRFFKFARVCEGGDEAHLLSENKVVTNEKDNLRDMFENRSSLHQEASSAQCEQAHRDYVSILPIVFPLTSCFWALKAQDGKTFTLSEAIEDIEAYTKLTVNRCHQVSPREDSQRIIDRDFYKCLGELRLETH
uniref:HD domain-containing protein n=1 Tax=Seriola dumerili TaxID=41447 RepID=A0A3B4UX88_SERDU